MEENEPARFTYRAAGVDIDAATSAMGAIKAYARSTFRPEVLSDIGSFGGLFALGSYRQPVLVASADGVGTKLKIAFALDKHDTIGVDLVNHCVNDILACGAKPLFFLDYFATGKLRPEALVDVVKGLAQACRETGCALIGGETAEMPGMYAGDEYDLAGFIVGIVERPAIIDGSSIRPGDAVIGLPSAGLHTNGYSLVRKVFDLDAPDARVKLEKHVPELGRSLGDVLLEPHRCYLNPLKTVLGLVKGLAHITGGGFLDNVPRVLPEGVGVRIHVGAWDVLPIFRLIQVRGGIDEQEMYRVFNMGIGMVVICSAEDAGTLLDRLAGSRAIGEVIASTDDRRVIIE